MKNLRVLQTLAVAVTALIPIPGIAQTPQYFVLPSAFTPAAITAPNGGSSSATVFVFPQNGFTGTVTLNCTVTGGRAPLPTCSTTPASVNVTAGSAGPFRATLTVTSTNLTPTATYVVKIGGTSNGGMAPAFDPPAFPINISHQFSAGNESGGGMVALVALMASLALWIVWRMQQPRMA